MNPGNLSALRKEKLEITSTTLPDAYAVFGKKLYEIPDRIFTPDQRAVIAPLKKQLDALVATFAQQTDASRTVDPSKPASEWADGNTMAKATEAQIRKKYAQLGKLAFNDGIHPADCESACLTVRALTSRITELDRRIEQMQPRVQLRAKRQIQGSVLSKFTGQSADLSERFVDAGSVFLFSSPVVCTLAVLFPPIGLFLIWKHPTWGKFSKIRWATVSAACLLSLLMIGTTKKVIGNAIHLADFTVRSAGSALYDIAADNGIIVRPQDKPVWLAGSATPWKYEPIIDFSDAEPESRAKPAPATSTSATPVPKPPTPPPAKPQPKAPTPSANQNVYTIGFEPNGPFDPSVRLVGNLTRWKREVGVSMNEHHTGVRSLRLSADFIGPEKVKWHGVPITKALPSASFSFLSSGSKISYFLKGKPSKRYFFYVNVVDANGEYFGLRTDVSKQWTRHEFTVERTSFPDNWSGDGVLDFPIKDVDFGIKGEGPATVYLDDVTFTKPSSVAQKIRTPPSPSPISSLIQQSSLTGWAAADRQPLKWQVRDGVLSTSNGGADLVSDKFFDDFDFRCDFKLSPRSNSGIYLRGAYEIQLLDSLWTEANGAKARPEQSLGSVYGQKAPLKDAYYGPDSWNVLAVRLKGQQISVKLNGIQIINDFRLVKPTRGAKPTQNPSSGPILIQAVKEGSVSFRNMQITPLTTTSTSSTTTSKPIDLLALLNIGPAAKQGRWSRDARGLIGLAGNSDSRFPNNRQLVMPVKPAQNYELAFKVERLELGLGINIGLVVGGQRVIMVMDGSSIPKSGLENIDGNTIRDSENPTISVGPLLPMNSPRKVVCRIEGNSVTATCDGQRIIAWSGLPTSLSVPEMWDLPNVGLTLGGQRRFRFSDVTYTPL